jgi:hypothetical protein
MIDERRIAAIEARLDHLTARMDDLFEAFKSECSSTTKSLNLLDAWIIDIRESLNMAFRSLFPGVARDQNKINDILHSQPPRDGRNS